MKITLPAVPRSLERLRRFLDEALEGVDGEERSHLALAVEEAATNYIKYGAKAAEGCPLVVEVRIEAGRFVARLPRFCPPGAEKAIQPRPLDEVRPGGLGTHFIREIMDRVEYEPGQEGHMTLVLTKVLRASD